MDIAAVKLPVNQYKSFMRSCTINRLSSILNGLRRSRIIHTSCSGCKPLICRIINLMLVYSIYFIRAFLPSVILCPWALQCAVKTKLTNTSRPFAHIFYPPQMQQKAAPLLYSKGYGLRVGMEGRWVQFLFCCD
jgi:hypothetical protein